MTLSSSPVVRLDLHLVKLGLVSSRNRAARLIRAGAVTVSGVTVCKPSYLVGPREQVECHQTEPFVSRGGEKLAAALDHFSIDPVGSTCLDVGASTGGFTDCLLQRGAVSVCAVDVGHGQLDPKIAGDSRVRSLEGINARYLQPGELGAGFDLIVIDVSFISLTLVLAAVLSQAGPGTTRLIALIKPQFELDSEALNRKGIVKEARQRKRAVVRVVDSFVEFGPWSVKGHLESPIIGGDGNHEYLIYARKD